MFRKFYYHVVLGLVYRGKFGTLGLSRRSCLMDKPLQYNTLNELVQVVINIFCTSSGPRQNVLYIGCGSMKLETI